MQKIENKIVAIQDENNKTTKTRQLKECEAERNIYFEECNRLNVIIRQLRAEVDNLK